MEVEWEWKKNKKEIIIERRKENEIWKIWWTICTTRTKDKIK